jgi:glycerol-3-phosphate dehydrogenase
MRRYFSDLDQKTFDLIVIGGGIIGTGIARDAALRGLDTLLVEKEDFAYGTTSRSTRLIHGGLRYMRMFEFKLVWQDLHEREVLLHIAPHLVHKLEFVIPLLKSQPLYRFSLPFGLCLYDILAAGKSLPSWRHLSHGETLKVEPALADTAGLVGSYVFYDCQAQNMEQLCLENAISADEKDARILNHAETTDCLIEGGAVKGIRFRDKLTGENYIARGRIVVNAGGPWADLVWNKLGVKQKFNLRRTKGVHLLTRRISNNALVLFARSDARLFFIVPWNNNSLIGTTDTDYFGDLDSVGASKSDVEYLIAETRRYFPQFKPEDVYYTMAGLRPLVSSGGKAESDTSRAHKIIDHERRDNVRGLISILGGKITAYRAIAEEAVNLVCKKLKKAAPCTTAQTPLPGALAVNQQEIANIARQKGLAVETITHLAGIYGSRLHRVLKYVREDKQLGNPIISGYPDIRAQIKQAIEEEEALTVSDLMLRRSILGLGPGQGQDAVKAVACEMGLLLGWSNQEVQKQILNYQASVALSQGFRIGTKY